MRIAIFSDNFYPELSGISDSIIQLAVELEKLGHGVGFFVPKYSPENYKIAKREYAELKFANNIKIKRFLSLPFTSPTKQARLVIPGPWRWLSVKKFKPDIIHSQLFFGVGLEGLIAARVLCLPIIGTNHTRINEFFNNGYVKAGWLGNFMVSYMNWYYNHCDFITTPSESFLKEMIKNGITAPSKTIFNPFAMNVFDYAVKTDRDKIKKKYNLSKLTAVCVGRLAFEKNIDVIIRAIKIVKAKYPDINLALAGHGQAEASIRQLTKELVLEDNVKFLGTFNHHDLADLYRSSEIFVTASTSEVQSLTIIQGLACGLPAVGANCNSIPELIRPDNGLLFKAGDHKDLAEKIILLLSDSALRKTLSQGAINFVPRFSAPSIAKEWVELYERVKSRHNKRKSR